MMTKPRVRTIDPLDRALLQNAGFSRQVISSWTTGACYPSIPNLRVAAKALGMTGDDFLKALDNTRRMKDVVDKVISRRDRDRERRGVPKAKKDTILASA